MNKKRVLLYFLIVGLLGMASCGDHLFYFKLGQIEDGIPARVVKFEPYQPVPIYTPFRIQFDTPLHLSEWDVGVIDEEGNSVDVSLGTNMGDLNDATGEDLIQSLVISPPENGWKLSSRYTLDLSRLKDVQGYTMGLSTMEMESQSALWYLEHFTELADSSQPYGDYLLYTRDGVLVTDTGCFDLSNPENPSLIQSYSGYITHSQNYILTETALWDMTNPSVPVSFSHGLTIVDSWAEIQGDTLFLCTSDYSSLLSYDISSLSSPSLRDTLVFSTGNEVYTTVQPESLESSLYLFLQDSSSNESLYTCLDTSDIGNLSIKEQKRFDNNNILEERIYLYGAGSFMHLFINKSDVGSYNDSDLGEVLYNYNHLMLYVSLESEGILPFFGEDEEISWGENTWVEYVDNERNNYNISIIRRDYDDIIYHFTSALFRERDDYIIYNGVASYINTNFTLTGSEPLWMGYSFYDTEKNNATSSCFENGYQYVMERGTGSLLIYDTRNVIIDPSYEFDYEF